MDWRSNLNDSTLSDLRVIKIESEPILTVVMCDDEKVKTVDGKGSYSCGIDTSPFVLLIG